jgi:hypothetical protein
MLVEGSSMYLLPVYASLSSTQGFVVYIYYTYTKPQPCYLFQPIESIFLYHD